MQTQFATIMPTSVETVENPPVVSLRDLSLEALNYNVASYLDIPNPYRIQDGVMTINKKGEFIRATLTVFNKTESYYPVMKSENEAYLVDGNLMLLPKKVWLQTQIW